MTNELIFALILAIVQGITEWLPISSSGHLVLFEHLLNYEGGLLFEVALHFGTLMAVFVYFGGDIVDIIRELLYGRFKSENGRLGLLIGVASIPAAVIGFLFLELFESIFRNLMINAIGFAITGLFLIIASLSFEKKEKKIPSYLDAFLIGIAQMIAIIPGISRAGATISSGLLLGLDAKSAAKFSFLMAIPVIFGANILVIGKETLPPELIWGTLVSFVIGLLMIHLMIKYILASRKNLRWFGIYALFLAFGIFAYLILE